MSELYKNDSSEPEELDFSDWWLDFCDAMREYGLSGVVDRHTAERHFRKGESPENAAAYEARFCETGEW